MKPRVSIVPTGVAVAALLVALTACAAEPTDDASAVSNVPALEESLSAAVAGGAHQSQIDVLEQAIDEGELTYAHLETLYGNAMDCLTNAGFSVSPQDPEEVGVGSGLLVPSYLVSQPSTMTDSAASDLMDECYQLHISPAAGAYMDQPINIERYNATWDTPEVRECLKGRGFEIDEDATGSELNAMAGEDMEARAGEPGFEPCFPTAGG